MKNNKELKVYYYELNPQTLTHDLKTMSIDEAKRLDPKLKDEYCQDDCIWEGHSFGEGIYLNYSFVSSKPEKSAINRMKKFIEDIEAIKTEAYHFANEDY
jgi:hypothetical protein